MSSTRIYPYVYMLKNEETGFFYIGYRCANKVPAEQDVEYHGSSKSDVFKQYAFEKIVLAEFFKKEDAAKFELELIRENRKNPLLINKAIWPHYTMTGKEPWNKGKFGMQKWSENRYDKIFTRETRQKMSLQKKGKPTWNAGKVGAQVHSEETRNKIADSLKGVPKPRCSCLHCGKEVANTLLTKHIQAKH